MQASQLVLVNVTRRIVAVANPLRILLFGSAVSGSMTRDSDIDLLVIVRGPVHRRKLAQKIYRNLHGLGIAVDVVVATEEDVAKHAQQVGSILRPALSEGKIIYDVEG